ncbi:3',5'-cyclic-AMP phosphodiesterase [Veronia pacifica]|uniref:3',5'-cyclic adenosine monophosphate phosphodiesterase CpdA n=1 Tax=Veronia pacifica TaxID=1080227 RepID=A0A1C3EQ60_9GAMM|nr:3',5'-cyclic-AMP phosphodiesterase [Veronia pacifica]ODA35387.1 3',5'-cyclic-AMP phosphodiesterase [Veronia pacifica]
MRTCESLDGQDGVVRLLQITDTHLFSDIHGSLLGVNTLDSFRAVVDKIIAENRYFDAVIATGDLSQDHTAESYRLFVEGVAKFDVPCFWLPGNHDHQPEMIDVLNQKPMVRADRVMLGDHWQMILLDSQVAGVPFGELSESELAKLVSFIDEYPERHTLILLHHHPLLAGSAWLDQHKLRNHDALWQKLAPKKNVRAVVCGHIHQSLDKMHQDVRVLASPSTCIQFKPNSDDFAIDNLNPGWQWLELLPDGQLVSKVERLTGIDFKPDMGSSGY